MDSIQKLYYTYPSTHRWETIQQDGHYLVCRFSNERFRIDSNGNTGIGGDLTPTETHKFLTYRAAKYFQSMCGDMEKLLSNFGKKVEHTTPYVILPDNSSEWKCELFGGNGSITLHPAKGQVPNFFWRKMQYIVLGNKWEKVK